MSAAVAGVIMREKQSITMLLPLSADDLEFVEKYIARAEARGDAVTRITNEHEVTVHIVPNGEENGGN